MTYMYTYCVSYSSVVVFKKIRAKQIIEVGVYLGRWVQMVRVQHGREHSSRLQAANSRPGSRSQKLELASTTASMKLRKKKKT